jgi:hypothetical protein
MSFNEESLKRHWEKEKAYRKTPEGKLWYEKVQNAEYYLDGEPSSQKKICDLSDSGVYVKQITDEVEDKNWKIEPMRLYFETDPSKKSPGLNCAYGFPRAGYKWIKTK